MRFEILSRDEIERMHGATLRILETIGMAVASKSLREVLLAGGCTEKAGRVCFPPSLVEAHLAKAPKRFQLHGLGGEPVCDLGSGAVYFQTVIGPPLVMDWETGTRRELLMKDFVDITRVSEALEHIHIVSPPVPKDVDPRTALLAETAALLRHTRKPLHICVERADEVPYLHAMMAAACGGEAALRAHPRGYLQVSPISPLDFGEGPGDALVALARAGLPLGIIPCPMMGATGPMTIIGSVTQHNAEMVAGVVAAQMTNPGVPVVMSPRVILMDMKTGGPLEVAPDMGLAAACSTALCNFYGIPAEPGGFTSASKCADQQTGYEHAFNAAMCVLAGASIVGACGVLDNVLTSSSVQLVLDDEIASMCARLQRPLPVNDDTLAVEVMAEVIGSKATFLEHRHTRKHLRAGEMWRPTVGDRSTYNEWVTNGRWVHDAARERVREILAAPVQTFLAPEAEAEIERIIAAADKEI